MGVKSNFTVAGTYPSFFKSIESVTVLSNLVRGNFSKIVLSSNHVFGFSNLRVGKAPSPLKSKANLCVLGNYSPFSTIASNIPAYYAIILGLNATLT